MTESEDVKNFKNPDKPKKVSHIKMIVIPLSEQKEIADFLNAKCAEINGFIK